MIEVKPTEETETITCQECDRSFSVILEPDYQPLGREKVEEAGFTKAAVQFCPFCGAEDLLEE